MLKYYCVWLHKLWIYFVMVVTTAGIIIAGAFLFYWLVDKVPIFKEIITIKPTDTEGELIGESTASILPGFITGIIGIVLGFWLESVFIERLRILKKFCGLRCCLLEQMRFVLNELVVNNKNSTVNLYAIENIVSSPDSLAVLYSLPRYIKFPRHYGEYGEKFFDAARDLNDYNKAVTENDENNLFDKKSAAVKNCLEFMLAIDNQLLKQINGGLDEQDNRNTTRSAPAKGILSKIKKLWNRRKDIKENLCKNCKALTRRKITKGLYEKAADCGNKYVKAYCTLTDK